MSDTDTVTVSFDGASPVRVRRGSVLLAAALQAGVAIPTPCGGRGTCGKCRVTVTGDVSPATADETAVVGADASDGVRLACRTRVLGDVTVRVEPEAAAGEAVVISAADVRAPYPADPGGGSACEAPLGAAIDLGTTTLAVELVDLRNGDIVAAAQGANPQAAFGADVMSRIAAAGDHADELRTSVTDAISSLLASAATEVALPPTDLCSYVAVGNPAMTLLFLGEDATPLGSSPYEGADLGALEVGAAAAGLAASPAARLRTAPAISPFVGGDVVAGLLAAGLRDPDAPTLFVDLGTNGEIVLAHDGGFLATSTAAGPAFEGASISAGMRAEAGAIEHVDAVGGRLRLQVIGDVPARGLCGSGIIDLIAVGLGSGAIDAEGALRPEGPLGSRVVERDGRRALSLAPEADVALSQKDVREVQLAKSAVRTGLDLLLASAGLTPDDLDSVIVAGGFGRAVRAASLERIGLLPAGTAGRARFAGNAALEGARALLVSAAARADAERITARADAVDLAVLPAFAEAFLANLAFPGA